MKLTEHIKGISDSVDANVVSLANQVNALAPYSGYTQVSKKMDNFVFQEDANFTYSVADKNRFVKFGDKVVDTYGEELVTNGDFSDGTTGWVAQSTILNENGVIKATTTTSSSLLYQNLQTENGKTYKIVAKLKAGTTGISIAMRNSTDTSTLIISSTIAETSKFTEVELIFIAQGNDKIRVYANTATAGYYAYFDNISVREIKTADFTDTIAEVAEVITDGSNTTSVAVSAGDYVLDGSSSSKVSPNNNATATAIYIDDTSMFSIGDVVKIYSVTDSALVIGNATITTILDSIYVEWDISDGSYNRIIGQTYEISRVSDTFRAIEDAPIGTALTDTTYFEDRTQIGVTNQALAYHAYNTLTKAYEGIKTEILFSDVSKDDLLANPTWLARNGFSKVSQFLYSKGSYYVLPIGIWQSLNKGAYHPFLNIFGTTYSNRSVVGAGFWYASDIVEQLSTSDSLVAIDYTNTTTAGYDARHGAITGNSARPDSKFYDIVYPDQFIDVREYSKILNPYEVELIWDDKEENGVEEEVSISERRAPFDSNVQIYSRGDDFRVSDTVGGNNKNNILFKSGQKYTISYTVASVRYSVIATYRGVWNSANGYYFNNVTTGQTLPTGWSNAGILGIVIGGLTKPILSSNTKLLPKAIANPTYYSQVMKDRLASGTGIVGLLPELVNDSGISIIPNGTNKVFKLSQKMTSSLQVLLSTNSGSTWTVQTLVTSLTATNQYKVDYVNNTIEFYTAPASTDMIIVSTTDKCLPYIQSSPMPVLNVEPKVIASNRNEVEKSNIANQVSGKICVGNGTNGYESKVLENVEVINGSIVTVPTSNTLQLDNSVSSCAKYFKALSQGANGVVGSVYGKEMVWDYDYNNDGSDDLIVTVVAGVTTVQRIKGKRYKLTGFTDSMLNNRFIKCIIDSTDVTWSAIDLNNFYIDADGITIRNRTDDSVWTNTEIFNGNGFGDNNQFDQLTNSTDIDLNGNTIRTFVGHLPINGKVK